MWLTTQHGFYSIVADQASRNKMLVRSRERADLENFGRLVGWSVEMAQQRIIETRGRDYQWRILASREEVALFQQQALENTTYHNFKGQIAATPGQQHKQEALHQVWEAMAQLQECKPYSKVPRSRRSA